MKKSVLLFLLGVFLLSCQKDYFEVSSNEVCVGEIVTLRWWKDNDPNKFSVSPKTAYTGELEQTLNNINSNTPTIGDKVYSFIPQESVVITRGLVDLEVSLRDFSAKQIEIKSRCYVGTSSPGAIGVDWTYRQVDDILVSVENLTNRVVLFGTFEGPDSIRRNILQQIKLEPMETQMVTQLEIPLNSKFYARYQSSNSNEFCNIDGTVPQGNMLPPPIKLILRHACPEPN